MTTQAQTTRNTQKHDQTQTKQTAYTTPAIVHELTLETRAGSPLGIPNPLDPLETDPAE